MRAEVPSRHRDDEDLLGVGPQDRDPAPPDVRHARDLPTTVEALQLPLVEQLPCHPGEQLIAPGLRDAEAGHGPASEGPTAVPFRSISTTCGFALPIAWTPTTDSSMAK